MLRDSFSYSIRIDFPIVLVVSFLFIVFICFDVNAKEKVGINLPFLFIVITIPTLGQMMRSGSVWFLSCLLLAPGLQVYLTICLPAVMPTVRDFP